MPEAARRYTAVAIVLHWAIATAIVGNILLGWWMGNAVEVSETQARAIAAFQLHKSLGLTILVLSLLRLAWRLLNPPPPLPAAMPVWEKFAARATHWAFYALMIGIPLSGWLYVSTQWRGTNPLNVPTLWFGAFEVPHLFGLNEVAREQRSAYAATAFNVHGYLAWSAAGLLVLHVAAALKHHFLNRDGVLAHMVPGLTVRGDPAPLLDRRRTVILSAGLGAIVLGAAAILLALFRTPLASTVAVATAGPAAAAIAPGPATTSSDAGVLPLGLSVWNFAPARGEIFFSGTHAGVAFRGRFTRWSAALRFDAADLAQSSVSASIETGSATDGVPLHDETLPQAEWFDVAHYPSAAFRSTRITARDAQHYDIEGTLTLKNRELAVVPPLLLKFENGAAIITGKFEIDRHDADLGLESDPQAEYVSRKIGVEVRVEGDTNRP